MVVEITPIVVDGITFWQAKCEGVATAKSFLLDHALGILVKNNPSLFGVELKHNKAIQGV